MLRVSRRFTTVLLWLAIALLPVRGWASTTMPMWAGGPAQATQQPQAAAAAMPCHGEATAEPQAGHNCALCDLCHATAIEMALPQFGGCASTAARPLLMAAAPVEPRAPDRLYKPPRPLLA